MCFDFIVVINQVKVLLFTQFLKVCIYLLTFWLNFLFSVLRIMFDMLTWQFSLFIEHAELTIKVAMSCKVLSRIKSFLPTWMISWFGYDCCPCCPYLMHHRRYLVCKIVKYILVFYWQNFCFPSDMIFKIERKLWRSIFEWKFQDFIKIEKKRNWIFK